MFPMLQLNQGNHPDIKPGNWVIRKPGPNGKAFRANDTGLTQLSVSMLAVRQKAVDFSNQEKAIVSYDVNSTLFKKITARSNMPLTKCQSGPEMLVWMHETSHCGLATLYGGSKTQRTEYVRCLGSIPIPPTKNMFSLQILKSNQRYANSDRYSWYAPTVEITRFWWSPLDADLDKQVNIFLQPPKTWGYELSARLQNGYDNAVNALEGMTSDERSTIVQAVAEHYGDEFSYCG